MISYEQLLDAFWTGHKPDRPIYSRQYMAAVFSESPDQLRAANAARDRVAARLAAEIQTPVISGARFYRAEDYHQKYHLRHDAVLMREFAAYAAEQFVDSTVAARLNGYVAGRGAFEQLQAELEDLGLSAAAAQHLGNVVRSKQRR